MKADLGYDVFKGSLWRVASPVLSVLLLEALFDQFYIYRCVAAWRSWGETESDIRALFGDNTELVARALKETRDKYVGKEGLHEELSRLKQAWPELQERIRRQIIPFGEVQRRLQLVGAPYEPEQIGVSRARFLEAFRKLPYMRSRYSVVDVAFRCGWMEPWLERLFGRGGIWSVA